MTHVPSPPSAPTIDQHLMLSITIQYHVSIIRQGNTQTSNLLGSFGSSFSFSLCSLQNKETYYYYYLTHPLNTITPTTIVICMISKFDITHDLLALFLILLDLPFLHNYNSNPLQPIMHNTMSYPPNVILRQRTPLLT